MALAATPAAAKAKGCFTAAEQLAEAVVRHGLRLREGADACAAVLGLPTRALWQEIDGRFGARFAGHSDTRRRAFAREFDDDAAAVLAARDGRLVTWFRHYSVGEPYCRDITAMLREAAEKGWPAVERQARAARGEVRMDYRICG